MSFFKAYDMRGTFGVDFDAAKVYRIGRALPQVVPGRKWLVGMDCRLTGEAVKAALVKGLADSGMDVTDIGLCTTPMIYFFTARDGYDGSVMVTASHNPPADNGLKVSKRDALPVGYADGLDKVEKLVAAGECDPAVPGGRVTKQDGRLAEYLAWQKKATPRDAYASLKIAVDCSCGMASLFAKEMFPGAMLLNAGMDGSFKAHSPNPLLPEARIQLAKAVRENALDLGVIFDGDADRAMFVNERGEFVQPDYLIPVVASASGVRPGEKVIHDVRTSRGATEALKEMGVIPVMVPVGHAFAKPILRSTGAICGGELAGHYYFREFSACDSGLLAATRILAQAAKAKANGLTFSEMMRPILSRYANSGEINFRTEDKAAAIARALEAAKTFLPADFTLSRMDGIRIDCEDGWFNIRQSNTEPYLRLIAECKDKTKLENWLGVLKKAIEG